MPAIAARTVGGPGAGKTYRAMEILDLVLEKVIADPMKVGFVSFTRSARRVASSRAGAKFGIKPADLEKDGWFRTLHSCAYRAIGVEEGELLTGTAADNQWLKKALGDDAARFASQKDDDDYFGTTAGSSDSARALALWDAARNRQVSLFKEWDRWASFDPQACDVSLYEGYVSRYEAAKKKDKRIDFTDMLMRFVGRRFTGTHAHPFEEVQPQGDFPVLPVWMHDEAQDMSPLTALAFQRLSRFSQFVYLFGDDWQEVYSWAGADGRIFAGWPVQKEEVLPVSYRCPEKILTFANRMMHRAGLPKRPFTHKHEGGTLDTGRLIDSTLEDIRPGTDTLVLARTNEYAREAARILDENLVPWRPIKGSGGFAAPARAAGVAALVKLAKSDTITGEEFWRALALIPARANGTLLLERGTKSDFEDERYRTDLLPFTLAMSDCVGCTDAFKEAVSSGTYKELLEPQAARMAAAAEKHGVACLEKPSCVVGTLHSSKGMEADHVVLLNRLPYPTLLAIQEKEGLDEERRLWYVGATRAKERLTIAEGDGEGFPEL